MNEELQSTNEELQTMNDELRNRSTDLDASNAFLESVFSSLGTGVIVIDRDLRVDVWNAGATELWGVRADEARKAHFFNLDFGLPVAELHQPIRDVLVNGVASREITLSATNRKGRALQCRVTISPLHAADGSTSGAIMLMEEVPSAPRGSAYVGGLLFRWPRSRDRADIVGNPVAGAGARPQQLPDSIGLVLRLARPLGEGLIHPSLVPLAAPLRQAVRHRGTLLERAKRHPQRPVHLVGLRGDHGFGRIHVPDAAAEPQETVFVRFPQGPVAFGTREDRRRAGPIFAAQRERHDAQVGLHGVEVRMVRSGQPGRRVFLHERADQGADVAQCHHVIDPAGRDGAARHAGRERLVGILRDRHAAAFTHRGNPRRAVIERARENHANHARAVDTRGRPKERIDGGPDAILRR